MATKKVKKETEVKAPKATETTASTSTTTQATTQAAPAQAAPAQPATDLTIADLKNIGTIIDVASTRGAFRANEMATVGLVYNKLQMFLAKVAPETKPEEKKTAEAPAAAGK